MILAQDHFLETFERRRRNAASQEELAELESHAKACSSCALELSLMDELAADRRVSSTDIFADERAVAVAMRQLESPRPKRRLSGWVFASAAVLLASAAAAAGAVWLPSSADQGSERAAAATVAPSNAGRPKVGKASGNSAVLPPALELAPALSASGSTEARSPASDEPTKAANPEPESAAQLFAKANQLRRQGRDEPATEAYRELERRFAGSAEARQAMVTLGWLLLDRSRPGEALQQFELYLRQGGLGSEDALAGQALAQQRLGKGADERRTLTLLVSRYPTSANAARAKKRLAELP